MHLRTRVSLALGLAVAVVSAVAGAALLMVNASRWEHRLDAAVISSLDRLAVALSEPGWTQTMPQIEAVVRAELSTGPHLAWIEVDLDAGGRVGLARAADGALVLIPAAPAAGESRPIRHPAAAKDGIGQIIVGIDRSPLHRAMADRASEVVILMIAGAVAAWVAAQAVVSRLILRPLDALAARIAGQPEGRTVPGGDEVAAIASGASAALGRLASVLDAMPEAVLTVDARMSVERSNTAAARLLGPAAATGHALDECLGTRLRGGVALAAQVRSEVIAARRRLAPEQPLIAEVQGQERRILAVAAPLSEPGGAILVLRDVSDLLAARERIERTSRMEAIGRLAAGIAHDANNLLTAISASAELAALAPDPEARRSHAETAVAAVAQAAELYRQLQRLARNQSVSLAVLDLGELLAQTRTILEHSLGRQIQLRIVPSPVPLPVRGDRAALISCIINLAVNARDAMSGLSGTPTLTIAAGRADLDAAAGCEYDPPVVAGACAVLSVTDTGPGIPSDVLPHLFEPFFTTKGEGRGTGLGLASVHGTIRSHGGGVAVLSRAGSTEFRCAIPLFG